MSGEQNKILSKSQSLLKEKEKTTSRRIDIENKLKLLITVKKKSFE